MIEQPQVTVWGYSTHSFWIIAFSTIWWLVQHLNMPSTPGIDNVMGSWSSAIVENATFRLIDQVQRDWTAPSDQMSVHHPFFLDNCFQYHLLISTTPKHAFNCRYRQRNGYLNLGHRWIGHIPTNWPSPTWLNSRKWRYEATAPILFG